MSRCGSASACLAVAEAAWVAEVRLLVLSATIHLPVLRADACRWQPHLAPVPALYTISLLMSLSQCIPGLVRLQCAPLKLTGCCNIVQQATGLSHKVCSETMLPVSSDSSCARLLQYACIQTASFSSWLLLILCNQLIYVSSFAFLQEYYIMALSQPRQVQALGGSDGSSVEDDAEKDAVVHSPAARMYHK